MEAASPIAFRSHTASVRQGHVIPANRRRVVGPLRVAVTTRAGGTIRAINLSKAILATIFVVVWLVTSFATFAFATRALPQEPPAPPGVEVRVERCATVSADKFNDKLKVRRKLGGPAPKKWASKPVCVRPHLRRVQAQIKRLKRVPATYPGWDRAQGRVVQTAIVKAKAMRAKCRHMLSMLQAGIVESHLRDLDHGHADSIGWLQQRPSMGWDFAGDVAMAAWDFLRRAPRADKGQSPGRLAQAIQRSAFPDKYDRQFGPANRILRRAVPACR